MKKYFRLKDFIEDANKEGVKISGFFAVVERGCLTIPFEKIENGTTMDWINSHNYIEGIEDYFTDEVTV